MQARITDTRAPGVCHRAKLTCSGGELQAEGLSELQSAEGGAAAAATTYKLLKPTGNANNGNAVGGASRTSHPKDGTATVVPAQLEGWEFEIDSAAVKGSFSGRYKEAGSTKGVRGASGVLELSTNVDSLTDADNKYLYVNTAAATTVPAGFSAVSCGGVASDVPLQTSDLQLGAASNLNGARRLLSVKTSDGQKRALRRSTGNDQQVAVAVTTPAGPTVETFCATSGITCMPGYIWEASYDTLKCADNVGGACTHDYCCKAHSGSIHITNNAYHYSNKCNSLGDESTQRRMAFVAGMLIAILAKTFDGVRPQPEEPFYFI